MSTTRPAPDPLLATAYWTVGPRRGELRQERLAPPAPDAALVRTLGSGISRGTELLVHEGRVPDSVAATMRAPFQAGDFPFPVKHGYLNAGVVEAGPAEWVGRRVFCLFPHQDRYVVPIASLTPIPEPVPTRRALLAGPVETAVNALWDAPPLLGDRIAVVGAGLIGGALAALLRRSPLARLQLVDPDPARQELAAALGAEWAHPDAALDECDLVYHASATEPGLATGLGLLGDEGELVELSWYGDRAPRVPLGAGFHARRLSIRASQVSRIAPARRQRRTSADRMALVMEALADPALDALLGATHDFADLPAVMAALHRAPSTGRLETIAYAEPAPDRTPAAGQLPAPDQTPAPDKLK